MRYFADKRLTRFTIGATNTKTLLGDEKSDIYTEMLIDIIYFYTDKKNKYCIETNETLKHINQVLKRSELTYQRVPVDYPALGAHDVEIIEKFNLKKDDKRFIQETYNYIEEMKDIDYNNMFTK